MLKKRKNWLIRSAVVCLLAALLLSMPCAAYGETTVPFIRIDKDDLDYWQGELGTVRLLTGQLYAFQEMDEESGVDPDFIPSEDGLDTICISAARSSRCRSSERLPLLCGSAPGTEPFTSLICGRKAMVL